MVTTAAQSGSASTAALDDDEFGGLVDVPRVSRAPLLAPVIARLVVIAVFVSICIIAMLRISSSPLGTGAKVLAAAYMVTTLVLQLRYLPPHRIPITGPIGYLALFAQAVIAYIPALQYGQSWIFMPGFLAGSCLLAFRPALGWTSFALIVGSVCAIQTSLTGQLLDVVYSTVSTVTTGLVVYGLTRLATLVSELHAARLVNARFAVAQERLRMSRDLHDLLGYSMSAIVLKSELTHRLLPHNPHRAKEEVTEILEVSRQALADVRAVASGYRELSLEEEARSARSVLAAANVEVRMEHSYDRAIKPDVLTALATVLREGVTNVLRHSKAEHCSISIRQSADHVELEIVNDGCPEDGSVAGGGSGLRNLADRMARLRGELVAGPEAGRTFRLRARLPAGRPVAAREPAPADD